MCPNLWLVYLGLKGNGTNLTIYCKIEFFAQGFASRSLGTKNKSHEMVQYLEGLDAGGGGAGS